MAESLSNQYPISVGFTAKDMKTSIAFYRDQLGFELEQCWPDEKNPMWANLMLDRQSVMFSQHMDPARFGEKGIPDDRRSWMKRRFEQFGSSKPGTGVMIYLTVTDVDAYYERIKARGVETDTEPATQFYGLREFFLTDPDGYVLSFYTPIRMTTCQSCGMPLTEPQPGQMYCDYCTTDDGKLKSYQEVFEGTVTGYFMGMQKMSRNDAEAAARDHLSKMPAWQAGSE